MLHSENNLGAVTFSFALTASGKRTAVGFASALLVAGAALHTGLFYGGVWDDWRRVLGWLPAGPINKILLVIPPVLLLPAFILPLWMIVSAFRGDGGPLAFYFDNHARRLWISETRAAPPEARSELEALSGYGYGEIEAFDITTYITTLTRDTGTGTRSTQTTHYVVGFRKKDGEFWFLEEFVSEANARTLLEQLEQAVTLQGDAAPQSPRLPASVTRRDEAGAVIFSWKGRVPFGASVFVLVFAAALAGFGSLLLEQEFVPGFWFCVGFAALLGLLGVGGLVQSANRSSKALALRLTNDALEIGTTPLRGPGAFESKTRWSLNGVKSISTVFNHESRNHKTRFLTLKGSAPGRGEQTKTLDIAELTLSETVDLEQTLEHEIQRRGKGTKGL